MRVSFKLWITEEARKLGISSRAMYARYYRHRHLYRHLILHRTNRRVIGVETINVDLIVASTG